ncbi:MAG: wax ester/triacylglycerol synthase family O-acyltransferase [Deltaproteobacteria bacterium]|nr:wax ester/triacylglycerol synthase family O-acyltransferase [Deltaproteobacteria bacterium]MBW2387844.1 wax ester/triacylglycerol synthase family O-acyltransferase [Deltaproteobacteria bacterium]
MAYTHYDRLTALDASFLALESEAVHMHVGSVGIFDPGPLADESGGVDFERVLELTEAGLLRAPRFRQKLAAVPVSGHPVWVDDEHFNLLYHLRHTALPIPGDDRQLKRLVGRIMSEKLDRAKPMWEMWIVEGLAGGRVALISKVHHCLIDGISGVDLLGAFMGSDDSYRAAASEYNWVPRPAPGGVQLAVDEVWRRATLPGKALAGMARAVSHPEESLREASHNASGFVQGISKALSPASETPLNGPIGPHRRFDWARFDLAVVREIKTKLGGTINDVVLACVAGAVRNFLVDRDFDPDDLSDIDFRVLVPVSTRAKSQRGKLGNRISMVVAALPVGEADPRKRLELIVEETRNIKESGQAEGTEAFEEVSDLVSSGLITSLARLSGSRRTYNLVVTNVPGPQAPVYLNGAKMLESYPLVPLFENQALGIALFSYDGSLYWGFNSCWDSMPELHEFTLAIEREFETLRKL